MANGFTNPFTNPRGFFSSDKGGFFAPPEGGNTLTGLISDPRVNIGLAIAQGQPIGQAILGGAIQAKEVRDALKPDYATTKQAFNPQTGETVFATEEQIQTQGLQPLSDLSSDLPTDQQNYRLAVRQGFTGTFMDYLKSAKQPLVSMAEGESTFEKEATKSGFEQVKKAAQIVTDFSEIETRLNVLDQQLNAIDPVDTGRLEKLKMPFKQILADLNVLPQESLDQLSQQELFNATTSFIIPRMRVAGSGSTSDFEANLFREVTANIENTVQGNRVIVGGMKAIARYNKKRLSLMEKYLKENQNLLGFGDFADAELGSVFETYSNDTEYEDKVKQGILKTGDFVYDSINSQFRILTEQDIKGAY